MLNREEKEPQHVSFCLCLLLKKKIKLACVFNFSSCMLNPDSREKKGKQQTNLRLGSSFYEAAWNEDDGFEEDDDDDGDDWDEQAARNQVSVYWL